MRNQRDKEVGTEIPAIPGGGPTKCPALLRIPAILLWSRSLRKSRTSSSTLSTTALNPQLLVSPSRGLVATLSTCRFFANLNPTDLLENDRKN
ncbi:hypothetical protein F0562_013127 [Nyssa sinensis]|uniref:Uncharacterized protein n=1 Tax=Nyssa sinensis TaxID=561372 RepID=A0A5J4ZYI7_9ASTE|nr:hypothetical protein F0562_013127 [Nyssa sinensis]